MCRPGRASPGRLRQWQSRDRRDTQEAAALEAHCNQAGADRGRPKAVERTAPMNILKPFTRAATGVAHGTVAVAKAPAKFVRYTARVTTARNAAVALFVVLDEAAETPTLYRDVAWWRRLIAAVVRLVAVIPIAPEVKTHMKNSSLKLAAIGGLLVTLVSQLDPSVLNGIVNVIPEKYRPLAMSLVALITAGAAFAHPAPGQEKK